MRKLSIVAGLGLVAAASPAAAQGHRAEDGLRGGARAVEQAAPMVDRSTRRLLDLDVAPLLDALRPDRPRSRGPVTLRDLAGRDDPDFEPRLRGSIRRSSARLAGTMDALADSMPALRGALLETAARLEAAIESAPTPLPPGEVDDDWDRDLDEEGPDGDSPW